MDQVEADLEQARALWDALAAGLAARARDEDDTEFVPALLMEGHDAILSASS